MYRKESGKRRARLEGCFEAKLGKDFKEIMSKVREFLLSEKQKKKASFSYMRARSGKEREAAVPPGAVSSEDPSLP